MATWKNRTRKKNVNNEPPRSVVSSIRWDAVPLHKIGGKIGPTVQFSRRRHMYLSWWTVIHPVCSPSLQYLSSVFFYLDLKIPGRIFSPQKKLNQNCTTDSSGMKILFTGNSQLKGLQALCYSLVYAGFADPRCLFCSLFTEKKPFRSSEHYLYSGL